MNNRRCCWQKRLTGMQSAWQSLVMTWRWHTGFFNANHSASVTTGHPANPGPPWGRVNGCFNGKGLTWLHPPTDARTTHLLPNYSGSCWCKPPASSGMSWSSSGGQCWHQRAARWTGPSSCSFLGLDEGWRTSTLRNGMWKTSGKETKNKTVSTKLSHIDCNWNMLDQLELLCIFQCSLKPWDAEISPVSLNQCFQSHTNWVYKK